MPVIKRYPNRKLYNTEAKQYVTLDGIADLVRKGQEVRVVDHTTGEDLTALTLTQIMFEQEKKEGGLVPHAILSELVKAGGNTLSALQHALVSPLGLSGQVDEEIARRIEAVVSRGELSAEEGARLRNLLVGQGFRPVEGRQAGDQDLRRLLGERAIPTRAEVQRLANQVQELESKLEEVSRRKKPAAKRARRKKA